MKTLLSLGLVLIISLAPQVFAESLSEQYQQDLVARLQSVQPPNPQLSFARAHDWPPYCLTHLMMEAFLSRDSLTPPYRSQVESFLSRPSLPETYLSPRHYFAIHYATTGVDSVYQASVDTLNGGDGVPDIINNTGVIADSLWSFEVTHLGYPAPPADGIAGGGPEYDIYMLNYKPWFAAYTSMDVLLDSQKATSFIVLDSDPSQTPYTSIPLDAVKWVMAHEFFHAIQCGIDCSEYEGTYYNSKTYWWEMSATWMEEMAYDSLDLFKVVLWSYYDCPWISLRDFASSTRPYHPYSSVVFPLFLTEKWDTAIVKSIWFECRDLGVGPQFVQATDKAIREYSNGSDGLYSAFQEFTIWNLFTGEHAALAPIGRRFSEAESFPMIPDSVILSHTHYPFALSWQHWPDSIGAFAQYFPRDLAASYIRLDSLETVPTDLVFSFSGVSDVSWRVSLVAIPAISDESVTITTYAQNGSEPIRFTIPSNRYSSCYVIFAAVAIPPPAYAGSWGYDYSVDLATSAETIEAAVPTAFELEQNYPNPFNPQTTVEFSIPYSTEVTVGVFNLLGQEVTTLLRGRLPAGLHQVSWDGSDNSGSGASSGVYFLRVNTADYTQTRKMLLLK